MKKILTLLLCLAVITGFSQEIFLVDNRPGQPADFTDFQEAIDSVPAGSILYLAASNTNYGTVDLDKSMTIIGGGRFATENNSGRTQITTINVKNDIDSLKVYGVYGYQIQAKPYFINTLVLNGNRFGELEFKAIHILIENNVIMANLRSYNPDAINVIIQNNYFFASIHGFTSNATIIRNNLFAKNSSAFGQLGGIGPPVRLQNAIVENNIFLGRSPQGCIGCVFRNNLTFDTTNDTIPYELTTGENNFIGEDPMFVDVPNPYISNTFDIKHDMRLRDDSPYKTAGTDGTEIGLYGGAHPFNSSGVPLIPQLQRIELSNTVVPPGSEIEVKVKLRDLRNEK